MTINILPVVFNNKALLYKVTGALKKKFDINIVEAELNIDNALDKGRRQYYSTQILSDAALLSSKLSGKVLILTDVDIFVPVLTFVFGEAQLNGKHSIISICRLHEEFYSGVTNESLLAERTLKEILHELGHNFGLKHCRNWECVMHSSMGIEEVDIKGGDYCNECNAVVLKSLKG